jgi:aminoglycoside phosphotransferase (APT) family kinase protein
MAKPARAPREDLALRPVAVLALLVGAVEDHWGFRPSSCAARLVKRRARRMIVRYDLRGPGGAASVVGKWFDNERGRVVAEALSRLRDQEFDGADVSVPAPLLYVPEARVLFMEAVDGRPLRDALLRDGAVAARAGAWLAAFHDATVDLARECGPERQRRDVASWAAKQPAIAAAARRVDRALADAPDPMRPVHYDFYHSQALIDDDGGIVVLDFDQAGMGNPAVDVAHFEALLGALALAELRDPDGLAGAAESFRAGYGARAQLPERHPGIDAFAWLKLAYVATARGEASEQEYALAQVEAALEAA